MPLSNAAAAEVLAHVFKIAPMSVPTNLYVALSTADPLADGSGLAEPSGNAYARVQCNNWEAAGTRTVANVEDVEFAKATGPWGEITHFAVFDSATAGKLIGTGALTKSWTLVTDMRLLFEAGDLIATID